MKKIFTLLLSVAISIVLIGCDSSLTSETSSIASTTSSSQLGTSMTSTENTSVTTMQSTTLSTRNNEKENILLDFDLSSIEYLSPTKEFSLHSMISNDVIFQQQKEIRIFGKAEAGTIILIKLTKDLDNSENYTNYAIVPENGEWISSLPALEASFDTYTLTISDTIHESYITNCLIGEVWLISGQSNMELKVREMDLGYDLFNSVNEEYIRVFHQARLNNNSLFPYEPSYDVINGSWKIANQYDHISDASGIGFSFAYRLFYVFLQQGLQVPVAIINTPIGGTQIQSWLPRAEVQNNTTLSNYVISHGYETGFVGWNSKGWNNHNQVSANFNLKISPLSNFNIKGVAWYQGESDPVYQESVISIKALIDSWSEIFNKNDELLYFALIQVAPYDGADPFLGNSSNWYSGFAFHRRAQFDIVMDPIYSQKVFIVPIYDIDLKWDVPTSQFAWADPIHPVVKLPVGQRLSKMVMSFVYLKDEEYLAPLFDSIELGDDYITIQFNNVGTGLQFIKNPENGVTTVEVILYSGVKVNVEAQIISFNSIRLVYQNIEDVQYVSYSNLSRNELSNLAGSNGIPVIPFVIEVGLFS